MLLQEIEDLIEKLDKEYQDALDMYDDPRAGALGYAIDELKKIVENEKTRKLTSWFPNY